MIHARLPRTRRARIVLAAVVVVLLAALGGGLAAATGSPSITTRASFVTGTPEGRTPVRLDTTLYLPARTPAPAVLLTQGFGGSKTSLDAEATAMARQGFVVLTYSARGFGNSGGLIHFAAPQYEIHDAELLVAHLAGLPQVERVGGRPQIAAAGSSYGGGISLLLAAADPTVRAVAADITWNDLQHAFFPDAAGTGPGPLKRLWLGELFANGFPETTTADGRAAPTRTAQQAQCGRFAPSVCSAYQASVQQGSPTTALQRIMAAASPSRVLSRIHVPVLLTQGEQDSLFPLTEADATARTLAADGTPVQVIWRAGGHDDPSAGTAVAQDAAISWFRQAFGGTLRSGPQPFRYTEQNGVVSAQTGSAGQQTLQANGYPGIDGTPRSTRTLRVEGTPQVVASPAGGAPAVITDVPGVSGALGGFASALALGQANQTATFVSAPLTRPVSIGGAGRVRITVTTRTDGDVDLFAALRDVGPGGGSTLPSQLVAPMRLEGMRADVPRTVTVTLPAIVRTVLARHRIALTVSTTDFAYANPVAPRTDTIALAGDDADSAAVTVPVVSGRVLAAGHPMVWLVTGAVVAVLAFVLVALVLWRRRSRLRPDPSLADVPVDVAELVKEYRGGYRAVDGVSLRVERGQVVGLLGPNGAGKTTVLRVLVGLITPTSGRLHVFGDPVTPGAPVLARVGAFIEGPGFLPHLTGRQNLSIFWAATGRPDDEAEFATALDIAGLGTSIDRRVRAYSQGMRQRLGIAQAMLGLPDLLVLDEPTNGLDPPQIAEMREVLNRYAATGRTVVVSSHLLGEVEQTCTHVVVMHRGRVVAAGSVAEVVAGTAGQQLSVADPQAAAEVLARAGIAAEVVPGRRALEDVFLELIGSGAGDGRT